MPVTSGFDSDVLLNNPIDREYRQFMSSSLEQLGKQVQEGIKQIATNRQVKQMTSELQNVDPASQMFPQEMMGVIERYPLAVSDRRGALGLSMLGAQHTNWLQKQLKTQQDGWMSVPGAAPGTYARKSDPSQVIQAPVEQKKIIRTDANGAIIEIDPSQTGVPDYEPNTLAPGRKPTPKNAQFITLPNGQKAQVDPTTGKPVIVDLPGNEPKPQITPQTWMTLQDRDVDNKKAKFETARKQYEDARDQADGALGSKDERIAAQEPALRDAANNLKKAVKEMWAEYEKSMKEFDTMKEKFGPAINGLGAGATAPGPEQPYDVGGGIGADALIPEQPEYKPRVRDWNPKTGLSK